MALDPQPGGPSPGSTGEDRERLVIPTCVGCGAMGLVGSCTQGCREERLDLVGADAFDELASDRVRSQAAISAFQAVVEKLAQSEPPDGEWEAGYLELQDLARRVLRAHSSLPPGRRAGDEPVPEVTAWWCPDCGGLEAPQPCLGICVWRSVAWVSKERWKQQHEGLEAVLEAETDLRRILRQVAFVTPRHGRWKAGWQALTAGARKTLESATRAA